jgi:hypothetical protein
MTRELVRTEKRSEEELGELFDRLEHDAESRAEMPYTGTDAEKIVRYRFEEILEEGGVFYGQLDIEAYREGFIARGDRPLVEDYFAPNTIEELEAE